MGDKTVTEFWLNDQVLLRADGLARMMPGEAISIEGKTYYATKIGWAVDYAYSFREQTVRCNVELSTRKPRNG